MASSNTVVQSLVDEDKRGRVMSLFAMAFTGTTPLGNLGHRRVLAGGPAGRAAARWSCAARVRALRARVPGPPAAVADRGEAEARRVGERRRRFGDELAKLAGRDRDCPRPASPARPGNLLLSAADRAGCWRALPSREEKGERLALVFPAFRLVPGHARSPDRPCSASPCGQPASSSVHATRQQSHRSDQAQAGPHHTHGDRVPAANHEDNFFISNVLLC